MLFSHVTNFTLKESFTGITGIRKGSVKNIKSSIQFSYE